MEQKSLMYLYVCSKFEIPFSLQKKNQVLAQLSVPKTCRDTTVSGDRKNPAKMKISKQY